MTSSSFPSLVSIPPNVQEEQLGFHNAWAASLFGDAAAGVEHVCSLHIPVQCREGGDESLMVYSL